MEKESLRMALLGALRYGKALVLDIQETDMFDQCTRMFDEIQPGLMKTILNRSILSESEYSKLITDADLPEYDKFRFNTDGFAFVVLTSMTSPSKTLIEQTYPIIVE
ncbi:hypothetical protein LSH36_666g01019 [Paralvinella palmiformis]|uniref:Uncharacterized protein n=1 Tax=Paralvinella palmiformis TaxID=53620 RepID=A0AAD9MU96_9ANNE|nr:hypothetical protein LSH36_666g01019 [Paralvinella palmiformis]